MSDLSIRAASAVVWLAAYRARLGTADTYPSFGLRCTHTSRIQSIPHSLHRPSHISLQRHRRFDRCAKACTASVIKQINRSAVFVWVSIFKRIDDVDDNHLITNWHRLNRVAIVNIQVNVHWLIHFLPGAIAIRQDSCMVSIHHNDSD